MKGLILAGGTGSRLYPLTFVTNKHLLPVYNKPMIFYPIEILKQAGVTEIMVITGKHHAGAVFQLLGSGKEYGCKFTYRVQDEAGGIPQAISLAEDFIGQNNKFIAVNGDNIIFESIQQIVDDFAARPELEAAVILYEATKKEASRAGVAILEGETIKGFIEKPKDPPSNLISTGIYFFSSRTFDIIRGLKPSARGELEIVDVQNTYLARNTLGFYKLKGKWLDAGTIDELAQVNKIVYEEQKNNDA